MDNVTVLILVSMFIGAIAGSLVYVLTYSLRERKRERERCADCVRNLLTTDADWTTLLDQLPNSVVYGRYTDNRLIVKCQDEGHIPSNVQYGVAPSLSALESMGWSYPGRNADGKPIWVCPDCSKRVRWT